MDLERRIHLCYVLTTQGCDTFFRMTAISALSAKRIHPQMRITVLMDEASARAVDERRVSLDEFADDVVIARCPDGRPGARNRHMKTRIRELIQGEFVYLDADTVVLRSLDKLLNVPCDIAGVPNRHRGEPYTIWPEDVIAALRTMGWEVPRTPYINGGVLYYSDTDLAHAHGRAYHAAWKDFYAKTSSIRDQPSLNRAIAVSGAKLRILPIECNATVDAAPCFARGARILHFFSRGGELRRGSLLSHLLQHHEKTGEVDWQAIKLARDTGNAWIDHDAFWHEGWDPASEYLSWSALAKQHGDIEAALLLLRERFHLRPFSRRTLKLTAQVLTAAMLRWI